MCFVVKKKTNFYTAIVLLAELLANDGVVHNKHMRIDFVGGGFSSFSFGLLPGNVFVPVG
jgi:hypothetical protein